MEFQEPPDYQENQEDQERMAQQDLLVHVDQRFVFVTIYKSNYTCRKQKQSITRYRATNFRDLTPR